jgi:hypothetical protein
MIVTFIIYKDVSKFPMTRKSFKSTENAHIFFIASGGSSPKKTVKLMIIEIPYAIWYKESERDYIGIQTVERESDSCHRYNTR